jgi:hypothetical protein
MKYSPAVSLIRLFVLTELHEKSIKNQTREGNKSNDNGGVVYLHFLANC